MRWTNDDGHRDPRLGGGGLLGMNDSVYRLERFLSAQEPVYGDVVRELKAGRKVSHWMWFVFPQLDGLGRSATSRRFAIASLEEARAYLAHPILGSRLRECVDLLLGLADRSAADILGPIDTLKLRSSMTLFLRAAPAESVFQQVLDRYFDGEADDATDALLRGSRPAGQAEMSV
jgi:uncharacterized protein (DUF1810 family)